MPGMIAGYATRESIRAGEAVSFCVSADDSESFEFALVELIHGDLNPHGPGLKERMVDHPANGSYPAVTQVMHPGSLAVVNLPDGALPSSFAVGVEVCATAPGAGRQCLVSVSAKGAEVDRPPGWSLELDDDGRASLVVSDGVRAEVLCCDHRMVRGCWYRLGAGVDAEAGEAWLLVESRVTRVNSRLGSLEVRELLEGLALTVTPPPLGPAILTLAASGTPADHCRHFTGKLERPRLLAGAAGAARLREVLEDAAPTAEDILGAWDFSHELAEGRGWSDAIHDTSRHRRHGRLINLPTRAVTGARWDSSVHDYRAARDHYGAIHFHADDCGHAGWEPSVDITAPAGLASGIYAGRLRAGDAEHYAVFYVRPSAARHNEVAFLVPTASYRAYANDHCAYDVPFAQMIVGHTPVLQHPDLELDEHREFGLGLYDTHADGSGVCYTSRSRPILNLGPKLGYWLSSSVWQFNADLHIVDWLHERGPSFDVLTDLDLHLEGREALAPYKVVLTGSHPEYASAEMLDALDDYLDAGGRLMYLGGNGWYWVSAFHPEDPDLMEVRRWGGSQAWRAQPGEYHLAFTGELGGLWRNRARAPQKLVGVGFVAQGHDRSSPYRRRIGNEHPLAWVFAGTGVHRGEDFGDAGLVGDGAAGLELDIVDSELGTPAAATVLATSVGHTEAYFEAVEELYFNARGFNAPVDPRVRADLAVVSRPSGGAVFSTGSIAWSGALSYNDYDNPVSRIMSNVLARFLDERPLS